MKKPQKSTYIEIPSELFGGHIIASIVRKATKIEIKKETSLFKKGKCRHRLITDEAGWPYDFRSCALCGKGLGTV